MTRKENWPRGSKNARTHSARSLGFKQCPGCHGWSDCTCKTEKDWPNTEAGRMKRRQGHR